MRSSSFIAVDLSQSNTLKALESLQGMTKRMSRIRSALIFTSRAGVGIHSQIGTTGVQQICAILGQMPNLKDVKIDLNRPHHYSGNGDLTVKALTNLLQKTHRLQSLQLHQLDLYTSSSTALDGTTTSTSTSGTEDWKEFAKQLSKHRHWKGMEVVNCTGTGIGSLMTVLAKHSRSLKVVRIVGTPMPSLALAKFTARPQLLALELEDLPDITDAQVAQLALDLEHPQCVLKELHIRSSLLTEAAGETLTDMLWMNKSIQKLCLHLDCETLASGMAHCLLANSTLQEVDLRCYGDDEAVTQSVLLVAQTLQQNKSIRRLRLCLEIEFADFEKDILAAFSQSLRNNNHTLTELVLDDGISKHELPVELQQQLQLNAAGFSKLVAATHPNHASANDWIEALATPDNDLTTIYTILHNSPTLFAVPGCGDVVPVSSNKLIESSSEDEELSLSSSYSKLRFRLPFRSRSNDSTGSGSNPMAEMRAFAKQHHNKSNAKWSSSSSSSSSPTASPKRSDWKELASSSNHSSKNKGKSLRRKMIHMLTPAA